MGMFGFDGQARVMKEDTGSVCMKVGMVGLMVEREKVMGKRNEEDQKGVPRKESMMTSRRREVQP